MPRGADENSEDTDEDESGRDFDEFRRFGNRNDDVSTPFFAKVEDVEVESKRPEDVEAE